MSLDALKVVHRVTPVVKGARYHHSLHPWKTRPSDGTRLGQPRYEPLPAKMRRPTGPAERWIGIVKVRATALLTDVRLPPDYWSYACRWVAYVHTHRVTEIPINKALPHCGDVVVIDAPSF